MSSSNGSSDDQPSVRSSVKKANTDLRSKLSRKRSYSTSPPRKRSHRRRRSSGDSSDNDNERNRGDVDKENRHGKRTSEKVDRKQDSDEQGKVKKPKKVEDEFLMPTGGAYIPPARLRMLQQNLQDKNSVEYQRMAWGALKKSIIGLINKINVGNITLIVEELFRENLIRGRGVLAQGLMQAQTASPVVTNIIAALVAVINMKFPKVGELILRRLILQFRRAFKRNDKPICLSTTRFIGHLINQQVAHELLALEILTLLLQTPTDDSVEVAIGFLKEVGQKLTELSPRGVNAIFDRLRTVLHEASIDKRVQYMIEVLFAIRKDSFKAHEAVQEGLDLVEDEDQITHLLRLDDTGTTEDILNIFKFDPDYIENEEKYKQIRKDILGDDSDDESDSGSDSEEEGGESEAEETGQDGGTLEIIDKTETNLVALRRTIYLTIQSSLDYEECAHKMMKMNIKPGQEHEFCQMILDCCCQQRSYEKFFGLLAQRFCLIKKDFMEQYVIIFEEQYNSIHRLDTTKLRNVAKFFSHLLYSNAIPWTVISCIHLNEDDTTSSSRIFIKNVFQELSEYMGIEKLNNRLRDPVLAPFFEGLLPRDDPRNTRFAINFFTAIGLGGLTDGLREHLKSAPKLLMIKPQSDSSNSSDSDDSSSDDSSSSESSESSEEEVRRRSSKHSKHRSSSSRSHDSRRKHRR